MAFNTFHKTYLSVLPTLLPSDYKLPEDKFNIPYSLHLQHLAGYLLAVEVQ